MARTRSSTRSATATVATPGAVAPEVVVPEIVPAVVGEVVGAGPVDPDLPADLGRRLRTVRRRQRLSRAEVARSAGLTRREVAAYERGATVPATDLWCIAGSCGVDVAELLPHRDPLRVDADTLSVGDTVRRLRDGSTTDEVLTEYAGMVRELRNLGPDDPAEVREADLAALADSLQATPEEIQDRLGPLLGPVAVGDPLALDRFFVDLAPAEPVDAEPVAGVVDAEPVAGVVDDDPLAALRRPPVELDADPDADLTADPDVELDADLDADLTADPTVELDADPDADLTVDLTAEPDADLTAEPDVDVPVEPTRATGPEPEPEPEPEPGIAWRAPDRVVAGPGWILVGGPDAAVADDGTLALRPRAWRFAVADLDASGDPTVAAELRAPAGAEVGVLVRAEVHGDTVSGYAVTFAADRVALAAWTTGSDQPVALATAPFAGRVAGCVEVDTVGDHIVVRLDGTEVAHFAAVSRAAVEAGLVPCRGDRTGVVAAADAPLTVHGFSVAAV